MERTIIPLAQTEVVSGQKLGMMGHIDLRSLIAGALGGAAFWLLAVLSLTVSRFDFTLATIWLPNACAVAFLLRARLSNEIPFIVAVLAGGTIGNAMAGTPLEMSLIFSLANIVDIVAIVWLTRRTCGQRPDMTELTDLSWFVWSGGLVGPALSACVAALALAPDSAAVWAVAMRWFLTDSMAMVLVVPAALLITDAVQARARAKRENLIERALVLISGLLGVFLVFHQTALPLLFLIPPITLLHAFRLGSLGTAIFIGLAAAMATAMTRMELGPIVLVGESEAVRM
ncbi:MAG: MASE1 domain-containing protein, partial [Pseudomonadota bacterium]